jgi:hypothetical protein
MEIPKTYIELSEARKISINVIAIINHKKDSYRRHPSKYTEAQIKELKSLEMKLNPTLDEIMHLEFGIKNC